MALNKLKDEAKNKDIWNHMDNMRKKEQSVKILDEFRKVEDMQIDGLFNDA